MPAQRRNRPHPRPPPRGAPGAVRAWPHAPPRSRTRRRRSRPTWPPPPRSGSRGGARSLCGPSAASRVPVTATLHARFVLSDFYGKPNRPRRPRRPRRAWRAPVGLSGGSMRACVDSRPGVGHSPSHAVQEARPRAVHHRPTERRQAHCTETVSQRRTRRQGCALGRRPGVAAAPGGKVRPDACRSRAKGAGHSLRRAARRGAARGARAGTRSAPLSARWLVRFSRRCVAHRAPTVSVCDRLMM